MTELIMMLISIIGYGTQPDFEHMPIDLLQQEVQRAEAHAANTGPGGFESWDVPLVDDDKLRLEAGWPEEQ